MNRGKSVALLAAALAVYLWCMLRVSARLTLSTDAARFSIAYPLHWPYVMDVSIYETHVSNFEQPATFTIENKKATRKAVLGAFSAKAKKRVNVRDPLGTLNPSEGDRH
jgi:hypothetical protein